MVCPAVTSFFTVSGVTATRVSPAVVSAGTPISIEISSGQGQHGTRAELTARLRPSLSPESQYLLALDDRDHCVCSYINASGAALWKPRRPFAPLVGVTALLFFWAGLAPAGSPAARTRKAKGTASHS